MAISKKQILNDTETLELIPVPIILITAKKIIFFNKKAI